MKNLTKNDRQFAVEQVKENEKLHERDSFLENVKIVKQKQQGMTQM